MKTEKQIAVLELAKQINSLGLTVYIAENGCYGFFTNSDGSRVISFEINFSWFNFSINHKSHNLGTGYRITSDGECSIYDFNWLTPDYVGRLLNSPPYRSRRKNEKFIRWTNFDEHMKIYNSSSKYQLFTNS